MLNSFRFLSAAVALATGAAVLPPVAAQGTRLQLADAYRAIDGGAPRLTAARALADAAEARVPSATRPPDPQLQLGFMNYGVPELEPMAQLGMVQLQLMQMIPTAGKLGAAGRIASARSAAQRERVSETRWEIRAAVAMAFYELYRIDRSLEVARETLRLLQDTRRTAESMYRVGEGRQTDVLRAQVEIARMAEDTLRMSAMRTAMAARFNALLDLPHETPVGAPLLPEFPDSTPSLDELIGVSSSDRPVLRAGEREVEAASAQSSLSRREIWPDLTVGVQYGRRTGEMGAEHMGSLMIGASVPIFASSRQLRMREESEAMRQMAVAELAAMRADTRAMVVEAHANLVRSRNLTALYGSSVIPQAEAAVASALSAYRVGAVDFMTLLDSRMTLNAYRQEFFTLEAEQGTAWADLEMLTGRELVDPNAVRGVASTMRTGS